MASASERENLVGSMERVNIIQLKFITGAVTESRAVAHSVSPEAKMFLCLCVAPRTKRFTGKLPRARGFVSSPHRVFSECVLKEVSRIYCPTYGNALLRYEQ